MGLKRTIKRTPSAELTYLKRRHSILQKIKGEAALFVSADEKTLTRDQHHVYRQNSDLLYLTGIDESECALLLLGNAKGPRSILFLKERDELKSRWGKAAMGLSSAKRKYKVDEIRSWESLFKDLKELISFSQVLHYALSSKLEIDDLVINTIKTDCGPSILSPSILSDSRLLTSVMRVRKERQEIADIKHACEITAKSFIALSKRIKTLKSELHAARELEAEFASLGGNGLAFNTIIAAGKNAVVLHHTPTFQPLWKSGLVLIDAGASFNGYCADITRTLPVSGKFTTAQAEAYDVVMNAYNAARERAQPGQSLDDLHRAAVNAICKGLISLGVLKGKITDLVQDKSYFDYYMHRTGHWLGLDVHDIAPITYEGKIMHSYKRPLEAGNLITIEPGLYFDPENKLVPQELRGIGIRIEDSILITQSGHTSLTDVMPKERAEIEQLLENGEK